MATKVGMKSLARTCLSSTTCHAFPAEDTTVAIDWCNTDKGGDLSSVEDTQFGQFYHQHVSRGFANAGNGLEVLSLLLQLRHLLNPTIEFFLHV